MTYTPDFTIEAKGEKIPLLFNSWALKQFSVSIGIELDELYSRIRAGRALPTGDTPELIRWAANSYNKFNGDKKQYSETDVYELIDKMGGWSGAEFLEMFTEVFVVFASKLLNMPVSELRVVIDKAIQDGAPPEAEEEKKSQRESQSPGINSTVPEGVQG